MSALHGFGVKKYSTYHQNFNVFLQEAARLHRESAGWTPLPTAAAAASLRFSPAWSVDGGSSRESSLDPSLSSAASLTPRPLLSKNSPRCIVIHRTAGTDSSQGFGFTLRHFIVYPPEVGQTSQTLFKLSTNLVPPFKDGESFPHQDGNNGLYMSSLKEPMDTIFVKSVKHGSSAHSSGLRIGKVEALKTLLAICSFPGLQGQTNAVNSI